MSQTLPSHWQDYPICIKESITLLFLTFNDSNEWGEIPSLYTNQKHIQLFFFPQIIPNVCTNLSTPVIPEVLPRTLQNPNYHPPELGGVKHLSLFEHGAPDRLWDALPYVSDISPPAFMKTGNQHINKTANNHKRNDIYIQPNQTEEACVCVQVMVVIRSVSR